MKKLKLSLLAIALIMATAVSAQVSFGIQGGVNLSNLSGGGDYHSPRVGLNGGILTDFGLTHNTGIRSGLFFHTKGFKRDYYMENTNLMYLQIPIHFAYFVDVMPGTRIVFHGGPYIAYGVGERFETDGVRRTYTMFGDNGRYNPFDWGLGFGVGFEFGRFLTGIGWDMGLLNISNNADATHRNMNAHLTFGFRF